MKKPTRKQAILAKCHECCGYYTDGKFDCEVRKCPLYEYMPYREHEPELEWMQYSPKRVGKKPPVKTNGNPEGLKEYRRKQKEKKDELSSKS